MRAFRSRMLQTLGIAPSVKHLVVVNGTSTNAESRVLRLASLTRGLLPPVLAEVGHHLARLTAVTRVGARVDVEGEHRLPHLHLVPVGQCARLALYLGLGSGVVVVVVEINISILLPDPLLTPELLPVVVNISFDLFASCVIWMDLTAGMALTD